MSQPRGFSTPLEPASSTPSEVQCGMNSTPQYSKEKDLTDEEQPCYPHGQFDDGSYTAAPLRSEEAEKSVKSSVLPRTLFRGSQSVLPRKRHFVAVEISKGHCERLLLQTPELLRRVHRHQAQNQRDCQRAGCVKLRDLRQLCSQSLGSQRASIEVRSNCIVFNLVRVRAIIMHLKVILLPQDDSFLASGCINIRPPTTVSAGYHLLEDPTAKFSAVDRSAENLEETLIKKLTRIFEEEQATGPFEFVVLEALLLAVCSSLAVDLAPILQEADRIMNVGVGHLSSAHRLHEVSDLQRQVGNLNDRLRGISDAIQEILNNELDLRRLELSRFWESPEDWEHPSDSSQSEDVEMLLECYEQEVGSMLKQSTRVDEGLDDTLQMIHLHLASIRNAFLKSELGLDIVGTIVTFVAGVASIFGMNIPSGLEDNSVIFWPMAYTMVGMCAITAVLTIVMFRRVKL